ncbi:amino acid adenylation domain-containing protein [Herpetosiphon gulosus]|uniref:Linear gramicidin synthase subunit D n=1 Tax=Herpetosiphon gulosus TaxID=1973496 RepID=A0ABP9X6U1_9CHLR
MQQHAVEHFRLSPQQTHTWLVQPQSQQPLGTWLVVGLTNTLSHERWQAALDQVIERHEALRTRFEQIAGLKLPAQVLHTQTVVLQQQQVAEVRQISELAVPPDAGLMHITVFEHGQQQWLGLWLSALVSDATSARLLLTELTQAALAPHELSATDELMQYIDAAEWQNGLLEAAENAVERAFWQTQALNQAPHDLRGFARLSSIQPTRIELNLAPSIIKPVNAWCIEHNIGVASTVLSLWRWLLSRSNYAQTPALAVAFDGRSYAELVNAQGLFERYLPLLPSEITANQPIAEATAMLEQQLAELAQFQEYFSWQQIALDQPLALAFAHYRWETAAHYQLEHLTSHTDLFRCKLSLIEQAASWQLTLDYDATNMRSEVAEALAESLITMMTWLGQQSKPTFEQLPIIGSKTQTLLTKQVNATEQSFAATPIHHLIDQQALHNPQAIAVQSGAEQLSYAELTQQSNQLTQQLIQHGIQPEQRVGLYLERSPLMVVALLACLKAGAAYVPLEPDYPAERIQYILADAAIQLVLSQTNLMPSLPCTIAQLAVDQLQCDQASAAPYSNYHPEQLAYVLYTSGSTGQPKGVMVSHAGLSNYVQWAIAAYDLAAGTGSLVHSPLAFDLTVTSLLVPLCAGQTVRLLPSKAGVETLAQALRASTNLSLLKLTPAHLAVLNQLIPSAELAQRSRALVIGGEALDATILAPWRTHAPETCLFNEYGPTETVVGCAIYQTQPTDPADGAVSIGLPIANMRLYVLDDCLQPVPFGVVGELYIGGVGVARGYNQCPDLTAAQFVPDSLSGIAGARLYRTGDLACWAWDGTLEYLGRRDNQIKLRGYRIELGEIEAVLQRMPAVALALVLVRGTGDDQRLVAYLQATPDVDPKQLSDQAVLSYAQQCLPHYMLPSNVVLVEQWSLTANGKVDRAALPEPTVVNNYVAPTTPETEILAAIWEQVLEQPTIGIDDNFFALGGNSIRSIQVVAHAKQRGLNLSVEMLFNQPTIRSLAQTLVCSTENRINEYNPFSLISPTDRALLPTNIIDAFPIAKLQGGMIFHNQFNPEQALYHDIFSYRMRVVLDLALLQLVVDDLVARHPALRTSFDLTSASQPLQVVHAQGANLLNIVDLRGQPIEQHDRLIEAWIAAEKQRGFEPSSLPLLRFQVHVRADDELQFSLSFHHAVIDGWSDAIMLTELFSDYARRLQGQPSTIVAPQIGYHEFVRLEQATIHNPATQQFWAEHLAQASPMRLPRWPNAPRSNTSQSQSVAISTELSQALKALSRSLAVPIKDVLLAAHLRVISMLTGQFDVVTSMVSSGRPETLDGERVLGLFINSIPLRMQLNQPTWRELILQTFAAERASLEHRRYPTAELQRHNDGLAWSESLFYFTHYHIFQALQSISELELLDVLPYEVSSFPLVANFRIDPFTNDINLSLTCDGRILSAAQIEAIAGYYQSSLTVMVANPAADYRAMPLLGVAEQQQLLGFNQAAAIEQSPRDLVSWLAKIAQQHPTAQAIQAYDGALSYAELEQRAKALAGYLQAQGIGAETRVGISLEHSTSLIVAILAVLKTGAAYVPLDPSYPHERLELIASDAELKLLICQQPELWQNLPASIGCLGLADLASAQAPFVPATIHPAQAAYLIYTSGSTGRPKGVIVSHANLLSSTFARTLEYSEPLTSFLLLSSYAFDSSIAGIFWTLSQAGCLVLPDQAQRHDILALATLIEHQQISHTLAIPSLYAVLLEQTERSQLSSLRTVVVAGEACSTSVVNRHYQQLPTCALYNEYGPTEVTVWATVAKLASHQPVSIGSPIATIQAYVVDPSMQPVPIGVAGELLLAGEGISRGYWQQPALTAERFMPNPWAEQPGQRLYHTGDLARWLPDGQLEFLGRIDQQVKIRGFRIEPEEIAQLLRQHPALREAVVTAQPDQHGQLRLVAYIEPRN